MTYLHVPWFEFEVQNSKFGCATLSREWNWILEHCLMLKLMSLALVKGTRRLTICFIRAPVSHSTLQTCSRLPALRLARPLALSLPSSHLPICPRSVSSRTHKIEAAEERTRSRSPGCLQITPCHDRRSALAVNLMLDDQIRYVLLHGAGVHSAIIPRRTVPYIPTTPHLRS